MIPVYALLGFAAWTLGLLLVTVGAYRWSRILTGRARVAEWRADAVGEQGSDFYRRAMRAHLNCVENLPVFGAIVVGVAALDARGPWLDGLALAVLGGRVAQSTIHVAVEQTEVWASLRFAFFFVQWLAMAGMLVVLGLEATRG